MAVMGSQGDHGDPRCVAYGIWYMVYSILYLHTWDHEWDFLDYSQYNVAIIYLMCSMVLVYLCIFYLHLVDF